MASANDKSHPLQRAGTRQADRFIPTLDPNSLHLEDRGPQEWLEFGSMLAKNIRFQQLFDEEPGDSELTWKPFFEQFLNETLEFNDYSYTPDAFDRDLQQFGKSPHGGLYRVYLSWLERIRDDLNGLTGRHLDFYYRDVLRFNPRKAEPDRVHVVFEPARNQNLVRVPQGTSLNAGKEITYTTSNEIFVGQAKLESLYSLLSDPALTERTRYAIAANSVDGFGEPLTEESPNWKPFGMDTLPSMEFGFAFASPVLALKEGARTITATLRLRVAGPEQLIPGDDALQAGISVELSGTEEWLGPFAPESVTALRVDQGEVSLVLVVRIGADEDPVDYYDISALEGGFDTVSPIMKIMLADTGDPEILNLLSNAVLASAEIAVDVVGAREIDLENDFGRLNPDKPFFPFGPQPVNGGSFYITSEEMLAKQVSDFKLHVKWQDVPDDLAWRYRAYLKDKIHQRFPNLKQSDLSTTANRYVQNNSHFKASMSLAKRGQEESPITVQLFDKDDATREVTLDSSPQIRPFVLLPYLRIAKYFSRAALVARALFPGSALSIKQAISPISRHSKRRGLKGIDQRVRLPVRQRSDFRMRKRKFGVIRISLLQGFFHRIYPHFLSATIADENSTASPEEPYTPVMESIELDYSAKVRNDRFDDSSLESYGEKTIQLFQLTPFGHAEQHAFLTEDLAFDADRGVRLLPRIDSAGALVLGIHGLEEHETISMLVQVAPGTANPLKERRDLQWSLLVRNHWRRFESSELLVDDTNGLLSSGIVRLRLPGEPLHDNTLFDPRLTWIRASVASDVDAVCDIRAIHLHAVSAQVARTADKGNVQGAIAANSIAKLGKPVAAIKSVKQPYDSFGGAPAESEDDPHFYRRVSERLRHKQRAVTAADYERLVLDRFPQLHMVRCLNHSDHRSCNAPGGVTLVVVPNTPPQERFDRLKPRADLDTISRIGDFVNALNTHQITATVTNPVYEEVQLSLSVRFHTDRPFTPYREILNEDLIEFLSPWVAKQEVMPAFGGSIHKSQIIRFIENRVYVDFVADVKLFQGQGSTADVNRVQPSQANAILVSTTRHAIEEARARS